LSDEQQIALLQSTKEQLVKKRQHLENKIMEVQEKGKKRDEREEERIRMRKLREETAMK